MLISVVLMALLLTFWMADSLPNRSLGAAAETVCSGTCEVEGSEYGCEGAGDFCIDFACCDAEDLPCSTDEVTQRILCYAKPVGEGQ